jgi:hypothetical protein
VITGLIKIVKRYDDGHYSHEMMSITGIADVIIAKAKEALNAE